MKATLTELRRDTGKVLGAVIHAQERVKLTQHGETVAEIVPVKKVDRKRALHLLQKIGPVELPPRK